MPLLANKLNQSFALQLGKDKCLNVPARGTVEVSDEEMALVEIQRLLTNRSLMVREQAAAAKAAKPAGGEERKTSVEARKFKDKIES